MASFAASSFSSKSSSHLRNSRTSFAGNTVLLRHLNPHSHCGFFCLIKNHEIVIRFSGQYIASCILEKPRSYPDPGRRSARIRSWACLALLLDCLFQTAFFARGGRLPEIHAGLSFCGLPTSGTTMRTKPETLTSTLGGPLRHFPSTVKDQSSSVFSRRTFTGPKGVGVGPKAKG